MLDRLVASPVRQRRRRMRIAVHRWLSGLIAVFVVGATAGTPIASPEFSASEKAKSARNEITAPRMFNYRLPFDEWEGTIESPEKAREWVRMAAQTGIDGIKLTAYPPEIMGALLDEAKKLGLGS